MKEIIVDGQLNKVGGGASKVIGLEIDKYMVRGSIPHYVIRLWLC